jgi:hypothetical protein
MRFKAREIWAGTLGTITLFYQLVGKGNDELYLIDILLGVIVNAGITKRHQHRAQVLLATCSPNYDPPRR